jgi:tetratricopeptide (TPR) repeat protein
MVTRAIERAQLPGERAFAWYARGSTLSALDRPGEARAAFRTALGFDPPRSLQADIHFALGILENNQQALSQARQLDPTIAQVSSVANLNTRHRQVRLTVTGQGSQGAIQQDLYVPPIYRRLLINGEPVLFLVDTGAAYTLLNRESRERVRLQPTPDTLLVSYADGRQERLVRYRPRSIALPGERPRPLRTNWMLGTPGRDNLPGRGLLSQLVSNRWFTEARGC